MENGTARENRPPARTNKHSYTVPCSSRFRDEVLALAERKGCNVADLARSVVLMVSQEAIARAPDPGDPARDDRETVILQSGRSAGKPWRRKPRLQVRMSPGFDIETVRKALSLAMAIDRGHMNIGVESQATLDDQRMEHEAQQKLLRETHDELERLRAVVQSLYFEPLEDGVLSREQALYVLGFQPGTYPNAAEVRSRFRRLATIYHPDSQDGSHQRMSQLNAAMERLRGPVG
ncbi:J domain-containing protein [Magnetovibrio sp. PR-2]|uniref:J domain-containing protein n=1 Tax=Magnetovibrio sp. PR-2 TaxID=3120356 RepID=UPI002FCE103B